MTREAPPAPDSAAEAAVFDAVLLPERLERTVTAAKIAASGGLAVEKTQRLMESFGLPRPAPSEPTFTPAEAEALVELGELGELWPAEVQVQVGRAYGAMLGAIARAELQAFQTHTRRRLHGDATGPAGELHALKSALERLLPLADTLLLGVHRRWIEHELGQRAVTSAEERAGTDALPGTVDVTLMFCDLKDFTAFAARRGDERAIEVIDRFFDVVERERGTGEVVKSLGDGALLVFADTCDAVRAGVRIIVAMRDEASPGVHVSVHHGTALARGGDYLGGTVNLAARLLGVSRRDELVATDPVVDACPDAFPWEPAREVQVRGVSAPVRVHGLRPEPQRRAVP